MYCRFFCALSLLVLHAIQLYVPECVYRSSPVCIALYTD